MFISQSFADIFALQKATQAELETIEGIGPRIAKSIVDWFNHEANQKLVEKLHQAGVTLSSTQSQNVAGALTGLTFVITGTLPTWSREDAKAFIEQHGGKITGTVSNKTNYLLAGEKAGSKLTKAQSLGVPIIDEVKLKKLVEKE
jgi:DNA ligase (NAD+)